MRGLGIVITLALLVAASNAHALTGADLYQDCAESKNANANLACVAYIHGFIDGMLMGKTAVETAPAKYCPPDDGISVE